MIISFGCLLFNVTSRTRRPERGHLDDVACCRSLIDLLTFCFLLSTITTSKMDYFDSLSPDITSRILSFTNTPTISRCCRISRNSLQIIQSNPNLHQQVDLFKLNRKQDLPLILFNLNKYSYFSRNTIKHVFINTAFMKQERSPQEPVFRDAFEIFDSRSSSSLDHNPSLSNYSFDGIPMIIQALYPSRATLQYLSFQIPDSHQFNVQRINHLIPYLDQHLPNLKGLFFYVPDALEDIQCGSDGSRTMVIKNNFPLSKTRMTQYDEQDLIKLLQTMRIFCRGQGLTRFCIDGGENKMSSYECLNPLEVLIEPVSTNIINELAKSRFSLKYLDLGSIYSYQPHHALELVLSCPNLESLNLGFAQRYYYYDVNRAWQERQAAIEDGEFDPEYDSQDDASDSDLESDLEADISDSGLVINVAEARYKKPLRFPSNLPFTSQLRHLDLMLDGRSFQVDHLTIKWIGSNLETLHVQEKHKSPSPAIERKQLFEKAIVQSHQV